MTGCAVCCATELCDEGRRLRDAFDAIYADWYRCPQGTIRRANMERARAAWHGHLYGSWDDEPARLTDEEEQYRLTGEEENLLAQVRARYAALIAERRER